MYDGSKKGLVPSESLSPSKGTRDGFVTFSIAQIRDWLTEEGLPIRRGQSVKDVQMLDSNRLLVKTAKGDQYETRIVIDATGARAKIVQLAHNANSQLITNRLVRYCYGGVFSYSGPEDKLLFVDKFPNQKDGAGWIMPLGEGKAEVVVGWEGSLGDRALWHTTKLPQLLSSYIEWFNSRGIKINPNEITERIFGVYSEGLLDYRKLSLIPSVIAFGESTGLNHPVNGYLIDRIGKYAQIIGEETERYLSTDKWNPYKRLLGESSINYGLANSHIKRKIESAKRGEGKVKATGRIKDLLVSSLGKDGFWSVIDDGIPLSKLVLGVIKHPQYIDEVIKIGLLYIKELFSNDNLYLSELGLKLKARLKNK